MQRTPLPNVKPVSRLDLFMTEAIFEITGEKIDPAEIPANPDFLSCLSAKIAADTGLDSADIARWVSASIKEYARNKTVY